MKPNILFLNQVILPHKLSMALKIKLIINQMIWQDNLNLFNSQIDLLRKTYELNRLNHQLIFQNIN